MSRGATKSTAVKHNLTASGLFGLLMLVVMTSAIALVLVKHNTQSLFVRLQELHQQRDALDQQWTQLLLEQSVWSAEARIDSIATKELGMRAPAPRAIIMVRT